jgi:hypothetical protein
VVAAEVTTTFSICYYAGVTLDGTSVKVAPGTPAGDYGGMQMRAVNLRIVIRLQLLESYYTKSMQWMIKEQI